MNTPETTTGTGAVRDTADVVALYQLFLGRDPEQGYPYSQWIGRGLGDLARSVVRSNEFAARMQAYEDGASLPGPNNPETAADLAGIARRLRPGSDGAAPQGAAASVLTLLATVLDGDLLRPEVGHVFGRRGPGLVARLRRDAWRVPSDGWLGFIDEAHDRLIRGWVSRRGNTAPARIGVMIDHRLIARVEANQYRADVVAALSIPGNCGIAFRPALPRTLLRDRTHEVSLIDLDSGAPLPFRRTLDLPQAAADPAVRTGRLSWQVRDYDAFRRARAVPVASPPPDGREPRFSVVCAMDACTDDDGNTALAATLRSLQGQTWANWDCVIVASSGTGPDLPVAGNTRVRVVDAIGVRAADAARFVGLRAAAGDFALILDPGATLHPQGLAWFAQALMQTGARLVYSDQCMAQPLGSDGMCWSDPVLAPAFDPDLWLQHDPIGTAFVVDADLARSLVASGCGGMADLLFRAIERTGADGIRHLSLPLFQTAAPHSGLPSDDHRTAVLAHMARVGRPGVEVGPPEGTERHDADWVRWPVLAAPKGRARISVIVATRDRADLLEPCIDSLRRCLHDPALAEVLIVDNGSTDPEALACPARLGRLPGVRVLSDAGAFNWSRINNRAAAASTGDHLLFLNNDTEMLTHSFDEVLRAHLDRPEVGVVGALLLYPDGTIQHGGVVAGTCGLAAHVGLGQSPADPDPMSRVQLTRRVAAVTGAFLAVRRGVFDQLGGFDETELAVSLNDVDFCLRAGAQGLAVIQTPAIVATHHESASRGTAAQDRASAAREGREIAAFRRRWGAALRFDLHHNPTFRMDAPPFSELTMPDAEAVMAYLRAQSTHRQPPAGDDA